MRRMCYSSRSTDFAVCVVCVCVCGLQPAHMSVAAGHPRIDVLSENFRVALLNHCTVQPRPAMDARACSGPDCQCPLAPPRHRPFDSHLPTIALCRFGLPWTHARAADPTANVHRPLPHTYLLTHTFRPLLCAASACHGRVRVQWAVPRSAAIPRCPSTWRTCRAMGARIRCRCVLKVDPHCQEHGIFSLLSCTVDTC